MSLGYVIGSTFGIELLIGWVMELFKDSGLIIA